MVMHAQTGEVVAYLGSANFDDDQLTSDSERKGQLSNRRRQARAVLRGVVSWQGSLGSGGLVGPTNQHKADRSVKPVPIVSPVATASV